MCINNVQKIYRKDPLFQTVLPQKQQTLIIGANFAMCTNFLDADSKYFCTRIFI